MMDIYVPPGFRGDDGMEDEEYIALLEEKYMKESVDHPQHYNTGRFEVIDVIEDWKLGFNLGNAIKYIARANHKGNRREDLEKARWYLEREIAKGAGDGS